MSRRLSASRSSRPPAATTDQTFEVVCSCGETLGGPRRPEPQTLSCPRCKAPLFVLPRDCYAGTAPERSLRKRNPDARSKGGLIEKLNRLAFWTRLREGRLTLGGQLARSVQRLGEWVKRRFSAGQ